MNNHQPLFIAGLLAAISLASLVFGIALPGVIAWKGNVFFQSGIDSKLPKNASKLICDFAERQLILKKRTRSDRCFYIRSSNSG